MCKKIDANNKKIDWTLAVKFFLRCLLFCVNNKTKLEFLIPAIYTSPSCNYHQKKILINKKTFYYIFIKTTIAFCLSNCARARVYSYLF